MKHWLKEADERRILTLHAEIPGEFDAARAAELNAGDDDYLSFEVSQDGGELQIDVTGMRSMTDLAETHPEVARAAMSVMEDIAASPEREPYCVVLHADCVFIQEENGRLWTVRAPAAERFYGSVEEMREEVEAAARHEFVPPAPPKPLGRRGRYLPNFQSLSALLREEPAVAKEAQPAAPLTAPVEVPTRTSETSEAACDRADVPPIDEAPEKPRTDPEAAAQTSEPESASMEEATEARTEAPPPFGMAEAVFPSEEAVEPIVPESATPEWGEPEIGMTVPARFEPQIPGSGIPEPGMPELKMPELEIPESLMPEPPEPELGLSKPAATGEAMPEPEGNVNGMPEPLAVENGIPEPVVVGNGMSGSATAENEMPGSVTPEPVIFEPETPEPGIVEEVESVSDIPKTEVDLPDGPRLGIPEQVFMEAAMSGPSIPEVLIPEPDEPADEPVRTEASLPDFSQFQPDFGDVEKRTAPGSEFEKGQRPDSRRGVNHSSADEAEDDLLGEKTMRAGRPHRKEKDDEEAYEARPRSLLGKLFNGRGAPKSGGSFMDDLMGKKGDGEESGTPGKRAPVKTKRLYLSRKKQRRGKDAIEVGNAPRMIIGRTSQYADIIVATSTVSEQHAVIEFEHGRYYLSDLGSKNGTWLNGDPVERNQHEEISQGDEIRFSTERFYALFE